MESIGLAPGFIQTADIRKANTFEKKRPIRSLDGGAAGMRSSFFATMRKGTSVLLREPLWLPGNSKTKPWSDHLSAAINIKRVTFWELYAQFYGTVNCEVYYFCCFDFRCCSNSEKHRRIDFWSSGDDSLATVTLKEKAITCEIEVVMLSFFKFYIYACNCDRGKSPGNVVRFPRTWVWFNDRGKSLGQ